MFYVFLAMAAITPVLYMPGSGGFEALKSAFFILLGTVIICWSGMTIIRQRSVQIERALLIPAGIIVGYSIIRTLFVPAPNLAWLGSETGNWGTFHWLIWWGVLIVVLQLRHTRRHKELTMIALLIALIGVLLVVVAQKTGLEQINWLLFDDPSRGRSLIGSVGSSGQLGLIIALLTVIIMPLRATVHRLAPSLTFGFWLLIIIAAGVVVATKSQSGIIILIIGGGLQLLAHKQLLHRPQWIAMVSIIVLLPVVAALIPTTTLVTRHAPSLAARIDTWKSAGRGIVHAPLFGAGIAQFPFVYDRYTTSTPTSAAVYSEEHPHSLIIELLAEWGIVGVGLIAWFCSSLLRHRTLSARHLPGLAVWLLAVQTNVGTVTTMMLGIMLALLVIEPHVQTSDQPAPIWIGWITAVTGGALTILAVIIGTGGVLYAKTNDTGVRQSDQYLFGLAATTYDQSRSWPFTRSYRQLEYAEAYTNNALKYADFSNAEPVIRAIHIMMQGSPTAHNLIIAAKIMTIWQQKAPSAEVTNLHDQLTTILHENWGSSPRFKTLLGT